MWIRKFLTVLAIALLVMAVLGIGLMCKTYTRGKTPTMRFVINKINGNGMCIAVVVDKHNGQVVDVKDGVIELQVNSDGTCIVNQIDLSKWFICELVTKEDGILIPGETLSTTTDDSVIRPVGMFGEVYWFYIGTEHQLQQLTEYRAGQYKHSIR